MLGGGDTEVDRLMSHIGIMPVIAMSDIRPVSETLPSQPGGMTRPGRGAERGRSGRHRARATRGTSVQAAAHATRQVRTFLLVGDDGDEKH